jgi:hypothetical protein
VRSLAADDAHRGRDAGAVDHRPQRRSEAAAASTTACTEAPSVTSPPTYVSPSTAGAASMAVGRSSPKTTAPPAASSAAAAAPSPDAAPVTIADVSRSCISSSRRGRRSWRARRGPATG